MPNIGTNGARGTSSSGTTAARITKPPATTRPRKTASTGGSRSMIMASKPVRRRSNGGRSSRGRGAVYRQSRAGDEGRLVRDQEEGGVGDLLGLAGAAHRVLLAAQLD